MSMLRCSAVEFLSILHHLVKKIKLVFEMLCGKFEMIDCV